MIVKKLPLSKKLFKNIPFNHIIDKKYNSIKKPYYWKLFIPNSLYVMSLIKASPIILDYSNMKIFKLMNRT